MLEKILGHIDNIVAAAVVLMGLIAVIFGRDSYVTAIIGTAMGYLFRAGVSRIKKGG
jgi:hypothetical protein